MRACGVDFTFAPCLDLDYGQSAVIGNRAFHRNPRVVSILATAMVSGMAQAGMLAAASTSRDTVMQRQILMSNFRLTTDL